MDEKELSQVRNQIKAVNAAARATAKIAAKALAACGQEPLEEQARCFLNEGLETARLGLFFLAMSQGISTFDCLSLALRRWVGGAAESEARGRQREALRCLLVEAGPEGAARAAVAGARITSIMALWAAQGDPVALSLALSMPGIDARALACEPDVEGGWPPLACAAGSKEVGARACCEILLSQGADPNHDMNYDERQTPLRCAIQAENRETCFLLAFHGADPSLGNHGKRVDDGASQGCLEAITAGQEARMLQEALGHGVQKNKKAAL